MTDLRIDTAKKTSSCACQHGKSHLGTLSNQEYAPGQIRCHTHPSNMEEKKPYSVRFRLWEFMQLFLQFVALTGKLRRGLDEPKYMDIDRG